MAALAGVAAVGSAPASAQTAAGPGAIDVHHHVYPPKFTRENIDRIVADIGIAPASFYLNWSPKAAIEKMDQAGVAVAINSMSSPGVWFGDGEAGRTRTRECNEYGAQLIADFPGRFGMFAALPLPDVEGSLREIAYATDTLKLDGIGLLTSYGGKLLGDPAFFPVYEELNRRRALVFVHPTMSCCGNLVPHTVAPTIEFPVDTTRTFASLMFGGVFGRFPEIRFVFSHGGGVLLPLVNRLESSAARLRPEVRDRLLPKGFRHEIERHFYDVASIATNPAGFAGLRKLVPNTQLLYGSDEPFASSAQLGKALLQHGLSPTEVLQVKRGNAERELPRLARA